MKAEAIIEVSEQDVSCTWCAHPLNTLFIYANTAPGCMPQHSISQRNATAQHSTAQHSTAQHGTAQHGTAQHSTAQHGTAQHSMAQHGTAQHSRAWHNGMARHSTAQHSTEMLTGSSVFFRSLLILPCRPRHHVMALLKAVGEDCCRCCFAVQIKAIAMYSHCEPQTKLHKMTACFSVLSSQKEGLLSCVTAEASLMLVMYQVRALA